MATGALVPPASIVMKNHGTTLSLVVCLWSAPLSAGPQDDRLQWKQQQEAASDLRARGRYAEALELYSAALKTAERTDPASSNVARSRMPLSK